VTIQDDRPVPKIIDFGVARATVQHLTERSLFTELGVLVGTPEYMSPEQAEMGGLDIDTRTDIYALGVLLYELLTGVLPFDRKELRLAGLVEIQRMIREKEAPRPSTRITQHGPASTEAAKNRHTEPRRLVSELRGDLDWITMRALEKDRTRRYQTANALGADVRRHLNSEPVSAGPPGALYRARKFVRRHRFGVAASGMLCLLLALFAVGSTYQAVRIAAERDRANQERDRANKEAETARRVTALLVGLFKAADPAQARGADLTAREVLGRGVATLEHELDDQPEVHARLLGAISDAMLGLGLYREAEAATRRMLAIYSSLQGANGMDTLRSGRRLCGLLVEQRRLEEADPICRQTLEGLRSRAGTEAHDLPNAVAAYAYLMFARGRLNEAELLFRESVEMRRRAFGSEHASTRLAIQNLAAVLQVEGQYSEAERLYSEALAAGQTRLGADHPDQLMTLSNLAEVLQEQGRFEEAEPRYREALAGERRVLPADHDQTATTLLRLASLLCQTQRFEEALPLAQDALGIYTRALSASDWRVADAKSVLGEAMTGLLRYREAEPLVIAGEAGIVSSSEPSVAWKRRATERVVDLYEAWGKPDRAREWRAKLEAQTPR
jgi:non-specific serine/threonine protein kinase/serine/threonine-protein kinase